MQLGAIMFASVRFLHIFVFDHTPTASRLPLSLPYMPVDYAGCVTTDLKRPYKLNPIKSMSQTQTLRPL
jgi:hypothetical protein